MSESAPPLVSVIIAVFNTAPYLRSCLESVQRQTFRDFECICVDDGSTDESLVILEDFAAKDARFRIISQQNQGPSAARNQGLQCASGKMISFVDSDDELSPDCLEKAISLFTDDVDFCIFDADGFTEDSGMRRNFSLRYFQSRFPAGKNELSSDKACHLPVVVWNKLFRAQIIKGHNISFLTGSMHAEDNVFFWEYVVFCRKFAVIDEVLYHYRQARQGALTGTKTRTVHACDTLIGCRQICMFWQQHDLLPCLAPLFPRIFSGMLKQAARHCAPEYAEKVKEEALNLVRELPLSWWQKFRMRLSIYHYC